MENDLESLSTKEWNLHLSLLGHSQNSIELESLVEKKLRSSLSMAVV